MNKKVIIVSGSSGEIGSAIVKAFIQDNCFVIGLDKDSPKKTFTTDFKHINVDLYNFSEDSSYSANIIENIKKSMPSNYSRLIIINNAALQILKPINEISISDWNNSFYINTFSPFFLVQAFLNELSSSSGQVINITSIHSRLTKSNFACYSASKAALDSLTRSMAIELSQKGISINSIAPAAILTNMLKAGFDEESKLNELESFHPSKSIGNPEDLAQLVKSVSLLDDNFLTGSVIEYNGGISNTLHDPN